MGPDLGGFAIADMEDLDGVVLELLARSLGPNRRQRDDVLVVADDVVQFDADGAFRGLERAAEPAEDFGHADVVAAERAPAGEMPADVLGKELVLQCVKVSRRERGAR